MSIFASLTTATVPIPFDSPNTVTIRRLTGREIEAAQEAHRGAFASGRTNAWAATFRRALEKGATDPEVLKALRDPLTGYDRFVLVRKGLVAWSYPQSVKPVAAKPAVTVGSATSTITAAVEASDAIEDLDDEAVDFIAREVLRLTKPALFHATEEDAAEEKKRDSELTTVT